MMSILAAAQGGGFNFHNMVILGSSVAVVLFLVTIAMVVRGSLGVKSTGMAAIFEHIFDWIDGLARDMIGPAGRQYVPFLMSLFLYILVSNWAGLLPWPAFDLSDHAVDTHVVAAEGAHAEGGDAHAGEHKELTFHSPTSSYNTTLALAIISFLAFNIYGLKKFIFPSTMRGFASTGELEVIEGEGGELEVHGDDEGDHDHHHQPGGFMGLVGWLMHFFQPAPAMIKDLENEHFVLRMILIPFMFVLFFALNVIEEVARILSLSIRLFGNIFGEHQVKINLVSALSTFLGNALASMKAFGLTAVAGFFGWGAMSGLLWGASAFATLLGCLAGFIQAMIFMVLSLVYIAHAVSDEH